MRSPAAPGQPRCPSSLTLATETARRESGTRRSRERPRNRQREKSTDRLRRERTSADCVAGGLRSITQAALKFLVPHCNSPYAVTVRVQEARVSVKRDAASTRISAVHGA